MSIDLCRPYIDLHDGQRTRFRRDALHAIPHLIIASEKPTLHGPPGHNGHPSVTLVTSGGLVRPLSNNEAGCCDSSSSLMKHRSFMLASSWCENVNHRKFIENERSVKLVGCSHAFSLARYGLIISPTSERCSPNTMSKRREN